MTLISRAALAVAPEAPETTAAAASALAAAVVSGSALAAAASALVVFVAPAAAGAGVALVMASLNGVHVPDLLGFEAVAVKAVVEKVKAEIDLKKGVARTKRNKTLLLVFAAVAAVAGFVALLLHVHPG